MFNMDKISVDRSFSNIGGHSLKIMKLISSVYEVFNIELPFEIVVSDPTIQSIAQCIEGELNQQQQLTIPLTFVQKKYSKRYQTAILFSETSFDMDQLNTAYEQVVQIHELLKTDTGGLVDGTQLLKSFSNDKVIIQKYDYSNKIYEQEEVEAAWLKILGEIKRPYIIQLGVIVTSHGEYLCISSENFFLDLESWFILIKDFTDGYYGDLKEKNVKTSSVHLINRWYERLEECLSKTNLDQEISYWYQLEQGEEESVGCKVVSNSITKFRRTSFDFTEEQTERVIDCSKRMFHMTCSELLVTILTITLSKHFSTREVTIQLSVSLRNAYDAIDLSNSLGCFICSYPQKIVVDESDNIITKIRIIKEILRRVPRHGIGYNMLQDCKLKEVEETLNFSLKPKIKLNELVDLDCITSQQPIKLVFLDGMNSLEDGIALEVSPYMQDHKLKMVICYDQKIHTKTSIEDLIKVFNQIVSTIFDFYKNGEEEVSLSDIVEGDIDTAELYDYLNNLK
ncbi:MAG: condensation domain-containing protein [Eubacteriales bacterium]|nr:condensation domain-containing protein [Eubacteriales bacterium]